MSVFVLLLASGWTITFSDFDLDDHIELIVPGIALLTIIHILCASLTYVEIDASHKYHDMAGVEGWVLFTTKILVWFYFCYLAFKTYKKIDKRSKSYFKL